MSEGKKAFRADIEGLRGIAIFIVVAFHCSVPGFPGGFIGVDVFFALSGYLITGLLVAEIEQRSRLNLLNFYARRIRRLLPISALALLVTLLAGAFLQAPHELEFTGRAARGTALYISNMFFAWNAADYFAPDVETNPLLHTWSLAVEEQFYVFWPLMIMLGLQFLRSRRALLAILAAGTALSLGVSIWLTAEGQQMAWYGLPARAWEFGLGGLGVLVPLHGRGTAGVWLTAGWLGLAGILAGNALFSGDTEFPGWLAAIPVLGTTVCLMAGAALPGRGIGLWLASAPMQFLGKMSYSWYIWHWPFLVFAGVLWPGIGAAGKTAAVILALLAAMAAHHWVENPIRFHPVLSRNPALCLYAAIALTAGSVGAAMLATRYAGRLAQQPAMKALNAATQDTARLDREKCVSLGSDSAVLTCDFGATSSFYHVVLFGDSHAIQWFNPLARLADSSGWKLTTLLKSGCPATDVPLRSRGARNAVSAACGAWRHKAFQQLETMRPHLVVAASAALYLGRPGQRASHFDISLPEWEAGTRRTLKRLTTAGIPVALMRDTPVSAFDIPTCLARSVRHGFYEQSLCSLDRATAVSTPVFEAEKAAAHGLRHVHHIDLSDRICEGPVCAGVRGGEVVYRDDNHLSGNFADRLLPDLAAQLHPLLPARSGPASGQ